jgi:hypothetical protein
MGIPREAPTFKIGSLVEFLITLFGQLPVLADQPENQGHERGEENPEQQRAMHELRAPGEG